MSSECCTAENTVAHGYEASAVLCKGHRLAHKLCTIILPSSTCRLAIEAKALWVWSAHCKPVSTKLKQPASDEGSLRSRIDYIIYEVRRKSHALANTQRHIG